MSTGVMISKRIARKQISLKFDPDLQSTTGRQLADSDATIRLQPLEPLAAPVLWDHFQLQ